MPTWRQIRCPICDVLVDRLEYRNHLRSIHPSYEAWGQKNSRNAFVALVIALVIVGTTNFLLPANDLILSLGAVGVVAVAAISTSYGLLMGKRKFRHAWKEQNAEGTWSNA
jgi:O-antigen/teichoic acid export membrane protein